MFLANALSDQSLTSAVEPVNVEAIEAAPHVAPTAPSTQKRSDVKAQPVTQGRHDAAQGGKNTLVVEASVESNRGKVGKYEQEIQAKLSQIAQRQEEILANVQNLPISPAPQPLSDWLLLTLLAGLALGASVCWAVHEWRRRRNGETLFQYFEGFRGVTRLLLEIKSLLPPLTATPQLLREGEEASRAPEGKKDPKSLALPQTGSPVRGGPLTERDAEATMLRLINNLWSSGASLEEFKLSVDELRTGIRLVESGNLRSASQGLGANTVQLKHSTRPEWLLWEPSAGGHALLLPGHHTFFEAGEITTLAKRCFNSDGGFSPPLVFIEARNVCRLRRTRGSEYLIEQRDAFLPTSGIKT